MRKKIEELRNREEGFTLVELLAVIVILGIIVAISIPAIGSVINRAQKDADKQEVALVVDAARLYVTTGGIADSDWGAAAGAGVVKGEGSATIKVEDLYTLGFLEDREGDEGEKLKGTIAVKRTPTEAGSGVYTYKYDTKGVTKAKTK